jgi:hypothetical protein
MRIPSHALAAIVLAACAAPAVEVVGDDGWSSGARRHARPLDGAGAEDVPRPHAIPSAERRRWERADELTALHAVGGRGPSEHLGGGLERTVQVNDAATSYGSGGAVGAGALIVERHHAVGSDGVLSLYVMTKDAASGWQFLVLDADLRVAADSRRPGMLEACARCHAEAPHDGTFGPPP